MRFKISTEKRYGFVEANSRKFYWKVIKYFNEQRDNIGKVTASHLISFTIAALYLMK